MLASVAIATREGASMSRRFLLLALLFVFAGCCTPQVVTDATLAAAEGNLQSLQLLRKEIPPRLPDDVVEPELHPERSVRQVYVKRLDAYIVRAKSIIAGLKVDKSFSASAAKKEGGEE